MKLLSFGEILWDVFPDNAVIGGAPFNFACHFAINGGESAMLSALGLDELGQNALKELEKRNVDTSFISFSEKQTGKCLVTLDEKGVPSYNLLSDVAYDYIVPKKAESFDVFYFGTLSLRAAQNRDTLKKVLSENNFAEIFCDVNIRAPFYSDEAIRLCFEKATVIKVSDEELSVVSNSLFKSCLEADEFALRAAEKFKNLKIVLITKGAKGAFAFVTKTGKKYECDAIKTDVVSTVGAGDSFSAAFMYKYMIGAKIEECLERAARVSAFVVGKLGAIPEYNPENL